MILQLVQRRPEEGGGGAFETRDVYDLDGIALDDYRGIVISGGCDQRFLAARGDRLGEWVSAGGRILVNGHPVLPFLPGTPAHRALDFHTTEDLWLTEMSDHPLWHGVDRKDLLFNTGVPGSHTFAELTRIGVAGFYAHAYLVGLPEGATVITGIGPGRLPVDVAYPLGEGEVILHLGNDLAGFAKQGTTASVLGERIVAHLEER